MNEILNVEPEDVGEDSFAYPFNISKIRIRRDPFTLGQLVDKIKYGEICFTPPYQRRNNLWDIKAQSRLIESVLLKLPLPSFYFDEVDSIKQIWNVVDGLQRCSSFDNFIVKQTLTLEGLEFLGDTFNGMAYRNLPHELHRRIMQTPLNIYVIEPGTPDEVKFNIFKRINTGGLILNPQEIRHAMNQGVAADYVKKLAEEDSFLQATGHAIKRDRMVDEDFIVRFCSFYLFDYNQYYPDLDSFLSKGMGEIRRCTDTKRDEMHHSFVMAMELIWQVFGEYSFRKQYHTGGKKHPLNKGIFETLSVTVAKLSESDRRLLLLHKTNFVSAFIKLHQDERFIRAISSSTGSRGNVITRFSMIGAMIESLTSI